MKQVNEVAEKKIGDGEPAMAVARATASIDEQWWRDAIKPIVLEMHRRGYTTVMIEKQKGGGQVQLFVE